jgi:hypothetical protein
MQVKTGFEQGSMRQFTANLRHVIQVFIGYGVPPVLKNRLMRLFFQLNETMSDGAVF